MNRKDVRSQVAAILRDNGYKKLVKSPRHTFHISDDEGNKKDFVVQQSEKEVILTVDDVEEVIKVTIDVICDALQRGETVNLVGFGTFGLKWRAPRRIPSFKGGYCEIEGHYVPQFKHGERLRKCCKLYEASLADSLIDPSTLPYDESADESLYEEEDDE